MRVGKLDVPQELRSHRVALSKFDERIATLAAKVQALDDDNKRLMLALDRLVAAVVKASHTLDLFPDELAEAIEDGQQKLATARAAIAKATTP